MASLRQARQMFADADARRSRGNGLKLPTDFGGCIWLQVKAVQLAQAAGKKDIDHGASPASRRVPTSQRSQRGQVVHAQPQQTDGAGLQGRSSVEDGML